MDEEKLKKEVAEAIKVIIEKYQTYTSKMEWPKEVFEIRGVKAVKIDEESLKSYDDRWTFEGTAILSKTDERNTVLTKSIHKIIGSAVVEFYPNGGDKNDLLADVKQITITQIKQ